MRKIKSKQENVKFSYCPNPVTIDKSASWGDGGIQDFPNGVFFKHDPITDVITHGVQPNEDDSAPVGWYEYHKGVYNKLPIFVDDNALSISSIVSINTLDGLINYVVNEPSRIVCNMDNGVPNLKDCGVMTVKEIEKNYHIC